MTFGPLVDAAWLAGHLSEVRIVDVRWYPDDRVGRDAYSAGHLPGAVHLDVDTDLSAPATSSDGRHPLPTPERFAAALARVGIAWGTPVVAYDDAGGSVAARLWWMLHVLDEPVAVLDGRLAAWPGELVTDVPDLAAVERTAVPWPADRFVTADEVAAAASSHRVPVYDARAAERYAGAASPLDPRPGHVPGAASAPWSGNLDEAGRFRSAVELHERFAGAGAGAIAYCGSGVTACHDLLAMTLANYRDIALYPGSWSQWGADPARPAETGATPDGTGSSTRTT